MKPSIRSQLIRYFVVFAAALGLLFGVITLLVFHRVEDRMIERRLNQMLSMRAVETLPEIIAFTGAPAGAPAQFQPWLAMLDPGRHEWEQFGRETHALVVDQGASLRTVALLSFPESRASEARLAIALSCGVLVTALLALALARYLALKIVGPIEQLTDHFQSDVVDTTLPEVLTDPRRLDEVGTLARTFDAASRALAASADRERQFLREASHELRTPITVIQGVAELLRDGMNQEDEETKQRLDRLDRGIRRMNTSVLSLLAMARAEHRLMVATVPPFPQQLDDLMEEARALATSGVRVTCALEHAPAVGAEASLLMVAVSNVVRNAVQHTQEGSVEVVVSRAQIVVRDSGTGIPSEVVEQLAAGGPQPDVGIGLATVQRICARSAWHLEVRRASAGGTQVTIRLRPVVDRA